MNDIKINVPRKARYIIETITKAGFEAYVVGGCVRDSILGREPMDWDITTSAKPMQVKALFPRTIDTGLQHGTVTVLLEKEGFEVTTYRIDGEYEDSRHPKEVIYTPNLEEDLKRRDLTINAMAYNDSTGLVDIFGGLADIQARTIRCVGRARDRFTEDALRILRAIRFSAQLGYDIEQETLSAIAELAPTLSKISAERIQVELVKLLTSPNPDYLRIAYESGVTKVFFPELDRAMEMEQTNPHHCYTVGEHTLKGLKYVEPDKILRLSVLLHDMGKPDSLTVDEEGVAHFHGHADVSEDIARRFLRRLKFDNDTTDMVCKLVKYHDYGNSGDVDERVVRRALREIGEDAFPALFAVKRADILAQSEFQRQEKLLRLEHWQQCYQGICSRAECVSLKTLAVTGSDLIAAGMKPGRQLGDTLQALLELVIEEPEKNTKEYLLEEAKKYQSQGNIL